MAAHGCILGEAPGWVVGSAVSTEMTFEPTDGPVAAQQRARKCSAVEAGRSLARSWTSRGSHLARAGHLNTRLLVTGHS